MMDALLELEKAMLGIFLGIMIAIFISKLRRKQFKLPPGPTPVPIFGNWLQVGNDLNHGNLVDFARRFGHLFLLRMGVRNLVVVSSPQLAKQVLHTQGVEFGSRCSNMVYDIFTGKGLAWLFQCFQPQLQLGAGPNYTIFMKMAPNNSVGEDGPSYHFTIQNARSSGVFPLFLLNTARSSILKP